MRWKRYSAIIVATVLFSIPALSAASETLPRIYVIGDSISMQYGPYLETYLKGKASYARKTVEEVEALELPGKPTANGGDSSSVLAYLKARAAADGIATDYLVVNCGLHDIKTNPETGEKQVPIEDYEENLNRIVAVAKKMGLKLVWVRTTPADEKVHNTPGKGFHRFAADVIAYNAVADTIMVEHEIPTIDLHTFTSTLGPDLYADHVHFPEHIREKQAAYIAGALEQIVVAHDTE